MSKIGICIPTYQRPVLLATLIRGIKAQIFTRSERPTIEVFVIDNDPSGSAEPVFRQNVDEELAIQFHYIPESRRGLCHVRNRAIDLCIKDFDFLCFIDDDEEPVHCWLDELLTTQREHNAACVLGPVYGRLPTPLPSWIGSYNYYSTNAFQDGDVLPRRFAATGNVLISCDFLRQTGLRFDERFSLIGGEDSFFFYTAIEEYGLKLYGAAQAIAYEDVPPARLDPIWIMKRKIRLGSALSMCEALRAPGNPVVLIRRLAKGFGWIGRGLITCIKGFFAGEPTRLFGLTQICFGAGMVAYFLGYVRHEYKRPTS